MNHITINELPISERPYEKFLQNGVGSLSDAELLAIIIKTGTSKSTSVEVAREVLRGRHNNLLNLYEYSYEELLNIPGIGKVKAIQLKTMAELSQRIARTERGYQMKMDNAWSISQYYMESMRHHKQEVLMAAYFDSKCFFLGDCVITIGGINSTHFSPREAMRKAIACNACYMILLHNHPSGNPTPSQSDIRATERMSESGKILGISVEDHIIIGDQTYFSFKEARLL